MKQAALHPLFFGKHKGVKGAGRIGGMLAQPEQEIFCLGGIGPNKEAFFEKGVLALCKGNLLWAGLFFKYPGNCGEQTVGGAVVEVSVHGVRKKYREEPVALEEPVRCCRQGAVAGEEGRLAGRFFQNFCLSR